MELISEIMKNKILLIVFLCSSLISTSKAQTKNSFITNLCQRWQLESIEMTATGHKFPPDKKMAQNYLQFNPDGIFISVENGTKITGKWKADEITKQIITSDFDNQSLTSPVIFNIVSLTKTNLAISNNPAIKDQVIMHYGARKPVKKKK